MADINLIPLEEKTLERIELIQKRLQIAAVGFLILTAVLTLVILAFFTSAVAKRNALLTEVEEGSARIEQNKSVEELLVVTKDKAASADRLISSRTEYNSLFRKLGTLIPQAVYFNDFRITNDKIVFSGKAKTSADIAGLASALVSAGGAEILNNVSVDSLSSDDTGIYNFVISAKLAGASTGSQIKK